MLHRWSEAIPRLIKYPRTDFACIPTTYHHIATDSTRIMVLGNEPGVKARLYKVHQSMMLQYISQVWPKMFLVACKS